jgi:hypothetical protein
MMEPSERSAAIIAKRKELEWHVRQAEILIDLAHKHLAQADAIIEDEKTAIKGAS